MGLNRLSSNPVAKERSDERNLRKGAALSIQVDERGCEASIRTVGIAEISNCHIIGFDVVLGGCGWKAVSATDLIYRHYRGPYYNTRHLEVHWTSFTNDPPWQSRGEGL